MKFTSLFVALVFCICTNAFSQEPGFKGPVVYLEVGGAGFATYNVNTEHLLLSKSKWYINGRAGLGYSAYDGDRDYQIPVGANIFYGKKNSHPEIGLYLTYSSRRYSRDFDYVANTLYFVPTASYRFQKPNGGIFFRISYAPGFKIKEFSEPSPWLRSGKSFHSFGLAIGYYFDR